MVGVDVEAMPHFTLSYSDGGYGSEYRELGTSYGLAIFAEHPLGNGVSVGVAPRYMYWNDDGPNSEIDLRARIRAEVVMAPGLGLYALLEPGWSVIVPSQPIPLSPSSPPEYLHPSGFGITIAVGLNWRLGRGIYAYSEVGEQVGFQSWSTESTEDAFSGDYSTEFLSLGAGIAMELR